MAVAGQSASRTSTRPLTSSRTTSHRLQSPTWETCAEPCVTWRCVYDTSSSHRSTHNRVRSGLTASSRFRTSHVVCAGANPSGTANGNAVAKVANNLDSMRTSLRSIANTMNEYQQLALEKDATIRRLQLQLAAADNIISQQGSKLAEQELLIKKLTQLLQGAQQVVDPAAAKAGGKNGTSAPKAGVNEIVLEYRSGWNTCYCHFQVDGKGWTHSPGMLMQNKGDRIKFVKVQGQKMEFVLTNGSGEWDSPSPGQMGSNYVINKAGVYRLEGGHLSQVHN